MTNKINFGKLKVWIEVANWYYGKIMQIVTSFGVLKLLGLSWIVLLCILIVMMPIIIYIVYLHMKYVYPKEVEYTWKKNPMAMKIVNNIK